MHLERFSGDAFGLVTISLSLLFVLLGLFCIFRSVFFWLRIRRQGFHQFTIFNGPWFIRIFLIVIALWWCGGEVLRLSFLKGSGRLVSSLQWQKGLCNFYIVSNLGLAEPSILITLALLLHAALEKPESGPLSRHWNKKTISYLLMFCLPFSVLQFGLVFIGPTFNKAVKSEDRTKPIKYFTSTHSLFQGNNICTYPLLSTAFLGLLDIFVLAYIIYTCARLLSSVMNRELKRRIYWLTSLILLFLPSRVMLLGFSLLPHPGKPLHEAIIFSAFCAMLSCMTVGVYMLVHRPIADSLALQEIQHTGPERMQYEDYYHEGFPLMPNSSHHEISRSSDASAARGSISFRVMIRDDCG